jgi:type IV secretion system protein TrbF
MLTRLINPLVALRNQKKGSAKEDTRKPAKGVAASRAPADGGTAATAGSAATAVPVNRELNPYVEARREWNERYGDYIQQAHHWRTMAILCGCVALVAVIGVGYIGAQNKVVPYVVEVDKLGEVAATTRADHPTDVNKRVIKAYLARFVADWRTVTVDRQAQKTAIDRVYAMLPGGSIALTKISDHFKNHNPFSLAGEESVAVAVTNILQISDTTWQVEWQEVTRDPRGVVQSTVRMKVSIIVGIKPPTAENLILINPLGVYITDLNWSQQL